MSMEIPRGLWGVLKNFTSRDSFCAASSSQDLPRALRPQTSQTNMETQTVPFKNDCSLYSFFLGSHVSFRECKP